MINLIIRDFKNLFITTLFDLTPKDKSLWLFGAWFGKAYFDNSKYLFEFVSKNHKDIKAIWVTEEKDVYELLKKRNLNVIYKNSVKFFFYILRAKVGVTSASCKDINSCQNKKIKMIWLWHGTPLKKIKYDIEKKKNIVSENESNLKLFYRKIMRKEENYSSHLLIAPSEEAQNKMSTAFKVNKKNIKITGYPRNDAFYIESDLEDTYLYKKLKNIKQKKIKSLIYMPTYRNWGDFNLGDFILSDIKNLNNQLSKLNIILFIKLHPGDMKDEFIKNNFSNIIFVINKDIHYDIYPYLKLFDGLITDYSSIYFDYLLLDKPILFAPFDFDKYKENYRTFYYDYNEYTPGYKAYSWSEIIKYLDIIFIKEKDIWREKRQKINKIFNKFNDDKNSFRVYKEIIKELK